MPAELAFARLVAFSRPLRGWSALCEERPHYRSSRYVRNQLAHHGDVAGFAVDTSEGEDSACARYHRAWLERVRDWYALPSEPGALGSLCYLFFGSVAEHDDGVQPVTDEGPFFHTKGLFLNIHQRGQGLLTVAGRRHRIAPGDAYLLNPEAKHGWTSEHRSLCKAASLLVASSLVPGLLKGSAVSTCGQG